MRIRNNSEKVGEIFRKNTEKSDIERKEDRTDRRKRRRKSRHHKEKTEEKVEPQTKSRVSETDSLITKQRITSKLGIYNKTKSSNKVLRDQKLRNIHKKLEKSLEDEMKQDLSRAIDCSSFRIKPLGATSYSEDAEMEMTSSDVPCTKRSFHESRTSLASSPRSIPRSSVCGSAVSNVSQSSEGRSGLAFKTPLLEISENLISSLKPADTFNGRNYFMEVKEQILKVFKQSSARLDAEIKQGQVSSEVYKRCLKRKAAEEELMTKTDESHHNTASPIFYDIGSKPTLHNDYNHDTWRDNQTRCHDTINVLPESSHDNKKPDHFQLKLFDGETSHTITNDNYSFTNMELLRSHRSTSCQELNNISTGNTSGFDILDFLDHSTANNAPHYLMHSRQLDQGRGELYEGDIPSLSPPKKPSLDTPTPPKFYRRKMY